MTIQNLLLRPHHGLCIRFFEGKGYNEEFTHHMEETIKKLQGKDIHIILTDKEDEICKKCPNFLKDGCRTKEKVQKYDEGVMKILGLSVGEEITFSDFQKQIEKKIIIPDKMKEICGNCGWAGICHR